MRKKRAGTAKRAAGKTRKLPIALARKALAKSAAARARRTALGRTLVRDIRRKEVESEDAAYSMGELLWRLHDEIEPADLQRKTFDEICELDLGMSRARCDWLMGMVKRVRKDDFIDWGIDKTRALLELANATVQRDTPGMLNAEKLKTPRGKVFDVTNTSAVAIHAFAKSLRASRGKGSVRGRTTTPDERRLAARIERGLHGEHVDAARVDAVATKPGAVSKLRIEIPADKADVLRMVLAKVHRAG